MTTQPRPCPACDSSATGCESVQLLGGRSCCPSCSGDHGAKPRGRWLRRKKRDEPKPETTPDLPETNDADADELPFGIY